MEYNETIYLKLNLKNDILTLSGIHKKEVKLNGFTSFFIIEAYQYCRRCKNVVSYDKNSGGVEVK